MSCEGPEASSGAESKYELREVIGKGAFGEVNLVVEKSSKQRFVLKRIKMARQSEWQRKATRQEIEIVSRLKHPFIMPYKEHWIHHGHTINVVYGYCEKGDLTTAIAKQKGKPFSEDTLRLWLAQLLLAVEYMHRANVLHRDIKTQNILLTAEGDIQIGDFGLSTVRVPSGEAAHVFSLSGGDDTDTRTDASPLPYRQPDGSNGGAATPEHGKSAPHHALAGGLDALGIGAGNAHGHHAHMHLVSPAGQAPGHTPGNDKDRDRDKDQLCAQTPVHDPKTGTRNDYALVGTPHFMSPELLSSQKYSFETDIWSLGVVMYELTTLKPPFNAFNLAGLVAKIKRAALPPIPARYSSDWGVLLKSMLRKDPSRRATALEVLTQPSMRRALQQAFGRARAMDPNYSLPGAAAAALSSGGAAPDAGFSFDLRAGSGSSGGAGPSRTPSAGGAAATPVLSRPAPGSGGPHSSGTGGGTDDSDSSPMPKFPDLAGAAEPDQEPHVQPEPPSQSARPAGRSTTAPRLRTAAGGVTGTVTAAAPADTKGAARSKTPALARRAGPASGAAAPATTPPPKASPAPQGARPAAVAPRSKTPLPARPPNVGALASPRGRVGPAAGNRTSAGEDAPTPGGRAVRKAPVPHEVRGRAASASGTANAVATAPAAGKGEPEPKARTTPPVGVGRIDLLSPAADGAEGRVGMHAAAAEGEHTTASTPTSVSGGAKPAAPPAHPTAAAAPAAASRPKEQPAPPRSMQRAQSFTGGRSNRTAAGPPPIAASVSQKRRMAAAAAADHSILNAHPSTSPSPNTGGGMRARASSTTGTAAPAPAPSPVAEHRRSQSGTAAAKEMPEAAGVPREKRPRRSSQVTYGRPGAESPAAHVRRQAAAPSASPASGLAREDSEPGRAHAAVPNDGSSAGGSAGGSSVESVPAPPAEAARRAGPAPDADALAVESSFPGAQGAAAAAGAGATVAPGAHAWRVAPCSRSFMTMATEDSELSLPDVRYAMSPEASIGGGCEAESGALGVPMRQTGAAGGSFSGGGAAVAPPVGQPLWSSNQLFTSHPGSFGGADGIASAAAAVIAAPAADAPAQGVRPRSDPLGTSMELPRRVSASAFSPLLLAGGAGAEGAAADGTGEGSGADSGASSPAATPLRRPSAGGAQLAAEEPGAEAATGDRCGELHDADVLRASPGSFVGPESPGSFSSLSGPASETSSPPAPLMASPRFGVGALPTPDAAAARPPQARRRLTAVSPGQGLGTGRSFRRPGRVAQQAVMRATHREMGGAAQPAADAPAAANGGAPAAATSPRGLYEEPSFGGSSTASVQRSFGGFAVHAAPQQPAAGAAAWRPATAASSSAAASTADATSALRPVAEEGGDEAESAPPVATSAAGAAEREQLALAQRVISVAGSLLEAGRVEELYCVLASTLSRPLARPAAAAGAPKRPDLEDRVRVVGGAFRGTEAVVRFRGPCHWCTGEVLGLELPPPHAGDEASSAPRGASGAGPTAAVRDGVLYFRCRQPGSRTAFVTPDQVALLG